MRTSQFQLLFSAFFIVYVSGERDNLDQPKNRYDKIEEQAKYWNQNAENTLRSRIQSRLNLNEAKNVILFLGDGMSVATVSAARIYGGQRFGHPGEESSLSFELFPYTALSKTYCVNSQVADSACSATAYLGGVKGTLGTIGVSGAVKRGQCTEVNNSTSVMSILHWAQLAGKSTGIVTTTRITHASPAGTYAHSADRDFESDEDVSKAKKDINECQDIASQLINNEPGKNIKVILGGGRREFIPHIMKDDEGNQGRRQDNQDLINEWLMNKQKLGNSSYVWNRKGLMSVDVNSTDYLLGLFSPSHMEYHLGADPEKQPTLMEMTQVAINILKKNKNGYFLFVEGGRIDHGHHETYAKRALDETVQFSDAINLANQDTDEKDTLIVVTSDHSHTMSFSGYPKRGTNILSLAGVSDVDNMPYATLSYANGPGYKKTHGKTRHNLLDDNMEDFKYHFPSAIPTHQETHGGEDVAVYAKGPYSHFFTGVFEQNFIPVAMMYAACIGPHPTMCSEQNTLHSLVRVNSTSDT